MPYAVIDAALAAPNEVLPAFPGRRYAVRSYLLTAAGPVTLTWKSGTTALSGAMSAVEGVPHVAQPSEDSVKHFYHFVTAEGEALNLVLSGAVEVSGHLTYDLIAA